MRSLKLIAALFVVSGAFTWTLTLSAQSSISYVATHGELLLGILHSVGLHDVIDPEAILYCPVIDSPSAHTSSTVPCATTVPPCTPGPGPMSITWSALRIISSSCSTTITVFPMSVR